MTPEIFFNKEAEALNLLFAEGLHLLHLRKPYSNEFQMVQLLDAISKDFHQYIVLHDHFELAERFSVKGIHLNSRNNVAPVGFRESLSRSCHAIEELSQYSKFDYLFLSPIFNSISKSRYQAAFSEKELEKARRNGIINERIFALGGINAENILQAKKWGFGGAVILGALWKYFDENKDMQNLLKHFIKLKEVSI